MNVGEQLQAPRGPHRLGKRVGDGLIVPALGFEIDDRPPGIDAVHRRADDVSGACMSLLHREG